MKKAIRIIFFSFVFLTGVGMIAFYFFTRRALPEQAQCIPKNSFLVAALNVKQLAQDQPASTDFFLKGNNSNLFSKNLFDKAERLWKTDSGLNLTDDILGFVYQSGDAAFIGIVFSVSDQNKIKNNFLNSHDGFFIPISIQGKTVVEIDTTSAIIGWNEKSLLLLYPFGNSSPEQTADECFKLLSQQKENSILSDENFCHAQLNSFDVNIWMHASPLLAFTNGGTFFKTQLDDVDYVSMNVEFEKGEIDIRKTVTTNGRTTTIPENLIITGDPKNVLGFIRAPMDLGNKDLLPAYLRSSPLSQLPFDDDQIQKLLPVLNGNSSILFHDTISCHFPATIINDVEKTRAMSYCFELKNEGETKKIFAQIAKEDSIPFSNSHWSFSDAGLKTNFFITDNVLTMTTDPMSDGKRKSVPDQWQGLDLYLQLGDYLTDDNIYLGLNHESLKESLSENFGAMTISQPMIENGKQISTVMIRMKNQNINALIPLKEMLQKIIVAGQN